MAGYRKMKKRKRKCRVKNQPRGLARIKVFLLRAARCITEYFGKKEPEFIPDCYIGSGEYEYREVLKTQCRSTPQVFVRVKSINCGRHWDRKRN